MRAKVKIGIVIVAVYILLVAFAIHTDGLFLIAGSTAALFASLGLLFSSNEDDMGGKNRVTAEFLSKIPGFGHLYLGRRKRSIPFLLVLLASLFSFYLLVLYPSDVYYVAFIMFSLSLLYAILMSNADVVRLCDKMDPLRYDPIENTYTSRVSDSEYYLVTFFTSLIGVIGTVCFWLFDWSPDRNIWLYVTAGIAWFTGLCISMVFIRRWMIDRKK